MRRGLRMRRRSGPWNVPGPCGGHPPQGVHEKFAAGVIVHHINERGSPREEGVQRVMCCGRVRRSERRQYIPKPFEGLYTDRYYANTDNGRLNLETFAGLPSGVGPNPTPDPGIPGPHLDGPIRPLVYAPRDSGSESTTSARFGFG
jgi:hypothetical protein